MRICFGERHFPNLSVDREHGVQCCYSYMNRKDWEGSGLGLIEVLSDMWLEVPWKITET
jgi:hypothetical protein